MSGSSKPKFYYRWQVVKCKDPRCPFIKELGKDHAEAKTVKVRYPKKKVGK